MNNNYNPWYAQQSAYHAPPNQNNTGLGYANQNTQYYNMGNTNGYYTNMYNNFYNPYYVQQQREKEAEELKKKEIERMMFHEKLNGIFRTYKNIEDNGERMSVEEQYNLQQQKYSYMQRLQSMYQSYDQFDTNGFCFDREEYQKPPEEHVDFGEFMANLGVECIKSAEAKAKMERMNLTKAYNRDNYAKMVNGYNNSNNSQNIVDAFSRDFTIDDMEITLPSQMSKQYEEKRRRFLEAIFSK